MRIKNIAFAVLAWALLILLATAHVAATEIIDERVSLLPGGTALPSGQVCTFAGQLAVIRGATISATPGGAAIFNAPENVLDATSKEGVDYVLTSSSLMLVKGKKTAALTLGGTYSAGRILFVSPDFFVYYLSDGGQTFFFTRTLADTQMYFAVGQNFISARLDEDANTVIATRDQIFSVDVNSRITPLHDLGAPVIEGMELIAADNTILIDTPNSLVKIVPNGNFYSVIAGRGSLAKVGEKFVWQDAEKNERYVIAGIEALGHPESDRPYVRTLLEQGRKLLALDLREQAYKKLLHVLEIMPREPEARQLVLGLGRSLYQKK